MKRTWKNLVTKTAARLLTSALLVTACLPGITFPAHGAGYGKDGVVRDMTSQQIVEDMGLGYNIGNTFDSIGSFITETDPWEYQRGWGNEPVSKHFIQKIKAAGFRTVRFPVSWAQWIDDKNQIHPEYMKSVQTVVDWCMEEDLYVILNIHHDSGAADTSWVRKAATDWNWTSKRYEVVWTQISENFKNYGDHLIFEGMNEVEFPDAPNMSKQYELLNAMNQLFVDTVRKTGGNNAGRHLLIPGYNTDIKKTCDRRYQFPKDSANHCILSIHYYSPSPFCVAEHDVDWAVPVTTWGSEEDRKAVEADLDLLAERYLSKGTPVIIGEYGVLTEDNKEKESIHRYLSTVPEIIMEYGMCPILWDTSNAGDMKFVERISGEFYDPVIKANYGALAQKKAGGQIAKRKFEYPVYKEVTTPVSPDGCVSLAPYDTSALVGIAFELQHNGDWDSYGGGGIVLDTWDNTINYQFNSVFDQVVHIFTPEEKARLKDQLTIAIWWTDETGGGNRREQLSFKNGQVTLLFPEDESSRAGKTSASSGRGGSGGGGGGTSRRPNNSTNPAGDQGTVPPDSTEYPYVIKGGNNKNPEEKELEVSLKEVCPGYEIGDKVRLTVKAFSQSSFTMAIFDNVLRYNADWKQWGNSDGTITYECAPSDGKVHFEQFWMEGSFTLLHIEGEVILKAPKFKEFYVKDLQTESGNYMYPLKEAYSLYDNVELGKRVRLKIHVKESKAEDANAKGKVWFLDENGTKVFWEIGKGDDGYTSEAVLVGRPPKSGKLMFESAAGPLYIDRIEVEPLSEAGDLLAELYGAGAIEITKNQITTQKEEGLTESGMRIYFQYDGEGSSLGGGIECQEEPYWIGNGDWEFKQDNGRDYVWLPGFSVKDFGIRRWDGGSPWKIIKVVYMEKAEFSGFSVKDLDTESGGNYGYPLKELYDFCGNVTEGDRVKLTVHVDESKAEDAEAKGTVWFMDQNGTKVFGEIGKGDSGYNSEAVLVGRPAKGGKLMFESAVGPVYVELIEAERLSDEKGFLAELYGAGAIEIKQSQITTQKIADLTDSGTRIYFQYDGDQDSLGGGISFSEDPWWIGSDGWNFQQDDNGEDYIWLENFTAKDFSLRRWDGGEPWRITKVVFVEKDTTRMGAPRKAALASERAKILALLEEDEIRTQSAVFDENLCYCVPEEIRDSLVGIMGDVSSPDEQAILVLGGEKMVSLTIMDGKGYYIFKDGDDMDDFRFQGQEIENVEFIVCILGLKPSPSRRNL